MNRLQSWKSCKTDGVPEEVSGGDREDPQRKGFKS
jgi:hypothetical protein